MKVLFVCSGNICRSPMAEACFRQRTARPGLSHVVIDSAGTLGIQGAPAAPEAQEALREIGVDLSAHRSKGVHAALIKSADLVVGMEHRHLEELARRLPEPGQERRLLRAFESGAEPAAHAPDLEDPIGHPLQFYRDQLRVLLPCLGHLALYVKHGR